MLKYILSLIALFAIFSLTACVSFPLKRESGNNAPSTFQQVEVAESRPEIKDPSSGANLWHEASSRNYFQDLRAHKAGDLVTVNIVETSKASKNATTNTGRESSLSAGIDNLLGWEGKLKHLTSLGNKNVRSAYDNTSMFKGSLNNSFKGSGTTTRDESMTASITARVMEVKPNGNLFIQGSREVKVNHETQYIILSGFIRPMDISPDNTVLSSYIGDARIEYIGSGSVSDKQRPGWLTRAVDIIWPF
ncbi:MAG: flagellar basal body L-ring protein FlgH [Deltaproteobacteria bacterium]|nr:flagellar basal body L-ring protein FlgH [Deltaproteobacteria bacterium]